MTNVATGGKLLLLAQSSPQGQTSGEFGVDKTAFRAVLVYPHTKIFGVGV